MYTATKISEVTRMADQEYGMEIHDGGFVSFEGVMSSAKKITSAVRDLSTSGKRKVTITYGDGSVYLLECDRVETDTQITLTNITESWNGKELTAYD